MNNEKVKALVQEIYFNPQTELEEEFHEAINNQQTMMQGLLMSINLAALFGSDVEISDDNTCIAFLADYMNYQGFEVPEKFCNELLKKYKLDTCSGYAKFIADAFHSQEAGEAAIWEVLQEKCGREFGTRDEIKLKNGSKVTSTYSQGVPCFLCESDSRESICEKYIEFVGLLSTYLSDDKPREKK